METSKTPLSFLLAGGFCTMVLASAVTALVFHDTAARVGAMAWVVFCFAWLARRAFAAPAAALMAWLFTTGFLIHHLGTLAFERADLLRLGLFEIVALLGVAAAAGIRLAARVDKKVRTARQEDLLPQTAYEPRVGEQAGTRHITA
ncbi:hypothetical protein [Nonomuraea endophytica]|uniref:DUF4118 domain-containing protein n=1 Tax=Nonomuraea endophytica TaxID=714136 RepID=A0A7W8EIE4_9ACTN|nr:hypothetical protein [Nonomuraea endophytica]MBB5081925.1 hypothetical protein [Nonomuraea endophytica]